MNSAARTRLNLRSCDERMSFGAALGDKFKVDVRIQCDANRMHDFEHPRVADVDVDVDDGSQHRGVRCAVCQRGEGVG